MSNRNDDYERRQRMQEFYREQDRRQENRRDDLKYEREQKARESKEGWEALRRGNTAWALSRIAGPDAGIRYLESRQRFAELREDMERYHGWARDAMERCTHCSDETRQAWARQLDDISLFRAHAASEVQRLRDRIDKEAASLRRAMQDIAEKLGAIASASESQSPRAGYPHALWPAPRRPSYLCRDSSSLLTQPWPLGLLEPSSRLQRSEIAAQMQSCTLLHETFRQKWAQQLSASLLTLFPPLVPMEMRGLREEIEREADDLESRRKSVSDYLGFLKSACERYHR
jgi:hypothetical protein